MSSLECLKEERRCRNLDFRLWLPETEETKFRLLYATYSVVIFYGSPKEPTQMQTQKV